MSKSGPRNKVKKTKSKYREMIKTAKHNAKDKINTEILRKKKRKAENKKFSTPKPSSRVVSEERMKKFIF